MPIGPGKYDTTCTAVRKEMAAQGVALIVINGTHGCGISVQATPQAYGVIVDLLEGLAKQIREDMARLQNNETVRGNLQ
jgi:hypothetical protein